MARRSAGTSSAWWVLARNEPEIALKALGRLRWIAVVGQLLATLVAWWSLDLALPIGAIVSVIAFTMVTNVVLVWGMRMAKLPAWTVIVVLLLDIASLTALLYFTGGSHNPFAMLYLAHVAMAVIVLGAKWTWGIALAVVGCYGALFAFHVPLSKPLSAGVMGAGSWVALMLVAVLISLFFGRVEKSMQLRDRELESMRLRAVRNERLAALTTLAAGAAHELNSPLGTIAIVAKELEVANQPDADAIREDARLIRREVDRCRNILSRMRIDLGEASSASEIDFTDLIARLKKDLRDDETGRLDAVALVQNQVIRMSARLLEQSLLVLLRNAFDASQPGQRVRLEIDSDMLVARFKVFDQGVGMSVEMVQRAGEPFYTTKEPGQGMGLGLFLVRLVAERSGAEFSIDSKPGQGTTCRLEVPLAMEKNEQL